jgi:hypothetical protein
MERGESVNRYLAEILEHGWGIQNISRDPKRWTYIKDYTDIKIGLYVLASP